MAKTVMFSEQDAKRIERAVRWFERFGGLPPQRRRPVFNGGGGDSAVWGVVLRGLQYADPEGDPAEGVSSYVVRLLTDAAAAWSVLTEYQIDAVVIASDDRKYKSLTVNTGNDPINSPAHWERVEEISPLPLSQEIDEPSILTAAPNVDMREFVPWFVEGATVKLVARQIEGVGSVYFFDEVQIRVKTNDRPQSVMWNEEENRMMAVFA